MKFSDIPSHDAVKQQLRNLVADDRIPHALLIEGPSGIGKFAMARAFAQYIHCQHRTPDGEPCGVCPSCLQHQSLNHIDTLFSFPVVKTERFKGDAPVSTDFYEQWKEYLSENPFMNFAKWADSFEKRNAQPVIYASESDSLISRLSTTAHASRYKIVLLWLAERMNPDCANKLLKLIEEPHGDTLFIMTSDNPEMILPTILSRCRRMDMHRLDDDTIARWLISSHGVNPTDATALAHIADGSLTAALSQLTGSSEANSNLELFIRLMRLAYQRKVAELRRWASDVNALGREGELRFYDYCQRLLRENFIFNFGVPQIQYMTRTETDFSRNFARFINENNVEQLVEVFNKAAVDVAGNGNGKIVNFDLAICVILLLKNS